MRITAGEWKGRLIHVPKTSQAGVRPSQAKLRQALFNSIQQLIPGARIADLFAGPGTLGLEALSRGAAHVSFVENFRPCLQALSRNLEDFSVGERAQVFSRGVEDWMHNPPRSLENAYDLILADPPYSAGWEMRLLEQVSWQQFLSVDGLLVLEWGSQKSQISELPQRIGALVRVREKKYGDSMLTTFQYSLEISGDLRS